MTTEFRLSQERLEALEVFRKTPEILKWLELVRGEFKILEDPITVQTYLLVCC